MKGVHSTCDGGFNTHCAKLATMSALTELEAAWNERLESARKAVEECFGRLKNPFQIIQIPSLVFGFEKIKDTWRKYLVWHNTHTATVVSRLPLDLLLLRV